MGRPITVTDPYSASVGYVYDSAGDRLALTYPDCRVAHYVYDLANRLTQASSLCQDFATNIYDYDAAGRLITTTLANGVTSLYTYDDADRLSTLTHSQFGWTLGAYTYTVDASGNRAVVVESLQAPDSLPGTITTTVISYTYDNLYRLTEADYSSGQVFTYTYDAVGNRLADGGSGGATAYAYDNANRLITINGTITYTWDANGNLIDNGQGVTYTYDATNRLLALNANIYAYTYDGLGNRLQQIASGVPITYTNDIAGDLSQVLVETTDTGATTYLYGLERLAQQGPASTDYFLDDGLGSVRQLADASGDVTLEKAYDPYGHPLSTLGSGSTNYDFAGEYKDPSALIFLRARYYTSRRGRFIEADTWSGDYSAPISRNEYLYADGNPVVNVDPSGHLCVGGFSWGADQPCTAQQATQWTENYRAAAQLFYSLGGPGTQATANFAAGFFDEFFDAVAIVPIMSLARCTAISILGDQYGQQVYQNRSNPYFVAGRYFGRGTAADIGAAGIGLALVGAGSGTAVSLSGIGAAVGVPVIAESVLIGAYGTAVLTNVGVRTLVDPLPNIYFAKSSRPKNSQGDPYPTQKVRNYGEVPFPSGKIKVTVPDAMRAKFTDTYREKFRTWWKNTYGWYPSETKYQIHHIQPLARNGTNEFSNLVPLLKGIQHQQFTNWWYYYP